MIRSQILLGAYCYGVGTRLWGLAVAACYFALFFWGLGVYTAIDIRHYAFIASRLQSAGLQAKLLGPSGITSFGPAFDGALSLFVEPTGSDILSNPSEIAAPRLMERLADIYFTKVPASAESVFSLSPRQVALWKSQQGAHSFEWLRVAPISGLGQTMNCRTYMCVLGYRLGVALFPVSKPCSTCFLVFAEDLFGDHAVSCAGMVDIKHRHNLVRDTLLDVCFRSGISAGKEVDIGLRDGSDRSLRHVDLLLYAWDRGRDVCVDLIGSSPLTRSGMLDFVPGQVVAEAAKRKCAKYRDLCAAKRYGFLPFSFSTLGELDADVVALLVRVRGFALAQDAGARAAHHIFSMINFAIAKGVGAQLVSRLTTNFM
ncbi:hypothetical protein OROMI_026402 [Orobanche minor]